MTQVQLPVWREDVLRIASSIRARFDPRNIEEIAASKGILLIRTGGPVGREAGFAYIERARHPEYIESLAHPGEHLRLWEDAEAEPTRAIVINVNSPVPECEVFWHEYYHLFYSPTSLQKSERFEHHYSTEGSLHHREERRADEFAAAVLIPSLADHCAIPEIMEHFGVSERLAKLAAEFYRVTTRLD